MAESATRTPNAKPIPDGYHTITAALTLSNAVEAIEFYKRAFGAVELARAPAPDGKKIWHAELQIGDSRLMLADEFPEMDPGSKSPLTLGGTPTNLHLYVEDATAFFERAVAAGATVTMPLDDVFWGDRYGKLLDPFGHSWAVAQHVEDVSMEEMYRRAEAFAQP
jgi:uncharacterized glyoxalase superfamily protein PhnB